MQSRDHSISPGGTIPNQSVPKIPGSRDGIPRTIISRLGVYTLYSPAAMEDVCICAPSTDSVLFICWLTKILCISIQSCIHQGVAEKIANSEF
jgi:hypothetical protein